MKGNGTYCLYVTAFQMKFDTAKILIIFQPDLCLEKGLRLKMASKKESFMQGVVTVMFSQILIKVLGLIYTLYLTNREGFGDAGNAIYASGYQIYALLLTVSSIGVPNAISKLVSERLAIRRQ